MFFGPGYVHQKELFFSHLTVREHLTFHAINRMSRTKPLDECHARVGAVLEDVDLTRVADSHIGGGDLYVTKGGYMKIRRQRRRR
jgi:ABC-type multidrug transport system ATPase subunit